jgi:hypothetical protein
MARSKEDKAKFINDLRASAKAVSESNPDLPFGLLSHYSFANACAIIAQRPSATQCAGFHAWRESGRSVKKGAKGIAVLVPLSAKDDDSPIRFSWRYVFDIADTEELREDSPRLARDLLTA